MSKMAARQARKRLRFISFFHLEKQLPPLHSSRLVCLSVYSHLQNHSFVTFILKIMSGLNQTWFFKYIWQNWFFLAFIPNYVSLFHQNHNINTTQFEKWWHLKVFCFCLLVFVVVVCVFFGLFSHMATCSLKQPLSFVIFFFNPNWMMQ